MKKLSDIVKDYCYEHVLAKDTNNTYERRVRAFEQRIFYDNVAELTRREVFGFRDCLIQEGKRHTTINNYLRHCRVIWQYGMQCGAIPNGENIFKIPKLPEIRVKKVITEETIQTALDELSPRNKWFWHTVITTQASLGIRNKQLVMIDAKHVNLDKKFIYLTSEGNKLRRENVLPLSDELIADLRVYLNFSKVLLGRDLYPDEKLFVIARYDHSFKQQKGNRMSCEQLQGKYHRLSRTVEKITGEKISGHRLRHTLATQIGSRPDINIRVVQEWFGWSCIQTAQNYVTVSVDQKRLLIEGLQNRLSFSNLNNE